MTRYMRLAAVSVAALSALALSERAAAQDIVMAGRVHGVEVPAAVRRRLAQDPTAYEFRRAMKSKLRGVQRARGTRRGLLPSYGPDGAASSDASSVAASAPARATHIGGGAVVSGVEKVIVLPITYSNTPAQPWPASDLQHRLFDPTGTPETLTQLYTEMSRGVLTMTGVVAPWTAVAGADTNYEGAAGSNGLDGAGLWNLLKATLDKADQTIDFSQYDDDHDGYVDLVAFVQPETGGECGGTNNMWSHRWVIEGAAGQASGPSDVIANGYLTNDGVRISDYVLQPALNCGTPATPISIGVFAHEFGHALGLPDLSATGTATTPPANEGIGGWGLMGAGNWNTPTSPAHMEAWSKMQLGWAPVVTVSADASHVVLDQVETAGNIIRINLAGTSEYFLLENRQKVGSDIALKSSGMLVWHVDSTTVADNWPTNTIQNVTTHKGLDLVEADGLAGLDHSGYRGGPGDPFPGATGKTSWTQNTSPSTNGYTITSGIAVTNIVESGGQISFDIAFGTPGTIAVKWGDLDGDGVVGQSDMNALYGCLNVGSCTSVAGINRADVDADNSVTLRDALIIHSYVVGGVDVSRFRVGQSINGTAPAVTYPIGGAPASKPAIVVQPGTP
jgi:M6 family metalloprotease-like protein